MRESVYLCILLFCITNGSAAAGELRMQWSGQAPDAREITLAPDETADLLICMTVSGGFGGQGSLSEIAWSNESAPELEQIGTLAGPEG